MTLRRSAQGEVGDSCSHGLASPLEDDDVLRLHVSMNDFFQVQVHQSQEDLLENRPCLDATRQLVLDHCGGGDSSVRSAINFQLKAKARSQEPLSLRQAKNP